MLCKIFRILIIISLIGTSLSKISNSLAELKRILKEINSREPNKSNDQHETIDYLTPYHHHQHNHVGNEYKLLQDSSDEDQTINLYFQLNNKEKDLLKRLLRMKSNTCKLGRCGCSGPRCGSNMDDKVADAIEQVVAEINKQVSRDNQIVTASHNSNSANENDYELLNLRGDANIILYSKYLDNLDKKLEDLTRNKVVIEFGENPEFISHLKERGIKSNYSPEELSTTDSLNQEDLINHYLKTKNVARKLITNYLNNWKSNEQILNRLSKRQKQLLRSLIIKYRRGLISDWNLESEIIRNVFDDKSNGKILPHAENDQNIYIHKDYYNHLLNYKNNNLRSKFRLLPLTIKQRARAINKEKTKPVRKLIQRRNLRFPFGIPFDMNVQGLAQINA